MSVEYLHTEHEGRKIFFSLTPGQLYGTEPEPIFVFWEVRGEIMMGEIELTDLIWNHTLVKD